jgi:P-type Ca2+ transporter type 2C
MVGGQIMIIFVGGQAFGITRINGVQWAICLLCALPCLLWAVLIRLFPDEWFGVFFNGTVHGVEVALRPIIKALHVVFHPVAQGWRAIMAPTKRATRRIASKLRKNKTTDEETSGKAPADEESRISSPVEKVSTPNSPPTNLPPITLTAPN